MPQHAQNIVEVQHSTTELDNPSACATSWSVRVQLFQPPNQPRSARAFSSLWKRSKWARIFPPSNQGLMRNARSPLRSSVCEKTVEAPSLAGSIWNLCKPATVNTGGPCHENRFSVFSYVKAYFSLHSFCGGWRRRDGCCFSPGPQLRT